MRYNTMRCDTISYHLSKYNIIPFIKIQYHIIQYNKYYIARYNRIQYDTYHDIKTSTQKKPESLFASKVAEVMTTRREGRKLLAAFTSPNKISVLIDLQQSFPVIFSRKYLSLKQSKSRFGNVRRNQKYRTFKNLRESKFFVCALKVIIIIIIILTTITNIAIIFTNNIIIIVIIIIIIVIIA